MAMTNFPSLPAVCMTPEGEIYVREVGAFDTPTKNKFSVLYAATGSGSRRNSPSTEENSLLQPAVAPRRNSSPTNADLVLLDADQGDGPSPVSLNAPPEVATLQTTLNPSPIRLRSFPDSSPLSSIARTHSMPLPSQLNHLQHPHRPSQPNNSSPSTALPPSSSPQSNQVREVSIELADSIQLVIQTMLQISPPQVLDPAKEQFSACALSVPTSSMSALFTAMKNINYISANMTAFCEDPSTTSARLANEAEAEAGSTDMESETSASSHSLYNEFDIGEMLQCVGDALSGAAANAGVDLVLYHGDVGLKHVCVSGDESGISFALSHIVRQVLSTTERGDSIELGLLVSPVKDSSTDTIESPVDDMAGSGPVRIRIRISHKYAPLETNQSSDHPPDVVTTEIRPKPSFSTLLLRRILKKIDGKLSTDLPPPEAFTSGRTCELEMVLDCVPQSVHPALGPEYVEGPITEPTLEQLSAFGDTLKGKKVTLYASPKGSFAHHLTSYLTAWGMDVTHVSPDGLVDGVSDQVSSIQEEVRLSSQTFIPRYPGDTVANSQMNPDPALEPAHPDFVFIDDDIDVLKERLQAFRSENQPPALNGTKKRPSLSSNHRPKSSPMIARLTNVQNNFTRPTVIMHFTCLSNYKMVRDVMQATVLSYGATSTPLPEVMIIPKPAGPRRFLTALHTAITKPFVDPLFIPIATSPMSPWYQHPPGSFFPSGAGEYGSQGGNFDHTPSSHTHSPSMKHSSRPTGHRRSNSDRSSRSYDNLSALPPSPLALPDNVEYFSAAAEKLGTSPSSGLVIQSPDGQTTGIYFHPRSKSGFKNLSNQYPEGKRPSSRRSSASRVPSGGNGNDNVTFSSLHEVHHSVQQLEIGGQGTGCLPAVIASPRVLSVGPVPMDDQRDQPSLAASILSPVPRSASDDVHRISTPNMGSDENIKPVRRTVRRNDHKDSTSGSKQKGKMMSSETVVPPISVLIVDDNPINQTILSTFMKRKKIKYDLASNGQEAVKKWRTGGFHLILMDIQMPVMDGIQATKEIRRLEKTNAAAGYPPLSPTSTDEGTTPLPSGSSSTTSETRSTTTMNSPYRSSVIIVALTASSLQADRVAALAAGCNDFLTKPVSLLWLNNKIIEWGSIKALQMWADIRPDAVKAVTNELDNQTKNVAENLHVPPEKGQGRTASAPPRVRRTSAMEDNAAAIALASSTGALPGLLNAPPSPMSSSFAFSDRDRARSGSPNLSSSGQNTRSNSLDNSGRSSFDFPPFRRSSTLEDDQETTPKPSTQKTEIVLYEEPGVYTATPIHESSDAAMHTRDFEPWTSSIPTSEPVGTPDNEGSLAPSEAEGTEHTRSLEPISDPPENTTGHSP